VFDLRQALGQQLLQVGESGLGCLAGGQRLGRLLASLRGFQSGPGFNGRQLFALFGQHLALAG
jgi:hypothetical protein